MIPQSYSLNMFSRFFIKLSLFLTLILVITLTLSPSRVSASSQQIQVTATVLEHITYLKNGDNLTFSTNYQGSFSVFPRIAGSASGGNYHFQSHLINSCESFTIRSNQGTFLAVVNF